MPNVIRTVLDGYFRLDGGAMFGVVPKMLWQRSHQADDTNRILLAARCMLIENGSRRFLVDAGIGTNWSPKLASRFGIDHSEGTLLSRLAVLGIEPASITDLIPSHLHFDHAGWLTSPAADGRFRPTFPNARVHVQRRHWDWAMRPSRRDHASFIPNTFAPLADHSELVFYDGPAEIAEGIEVRYAEGHTPGQQMIIARGGARTVVFPADLIPTASHVRLPFIMGYDLYPLETLQNKLQLLTEAVQKNWVIVFDHDPTIAAATIKASGDDFTIDEVMTL